MRKPGVLLSSYSGFHNLYCPSQLPINTSPCNTHAANKSGRSLTPSQQRPQIQQRRSYADINCASSYETPPNNKEHNDIQWPDLPTSTTFPTPYQIFQQRKGTPYCKQRFYELVKLYHPDRPHPAGAYRLSHATRLERYRLIVAANTILSDPLKRSAYDRYGAGWNGSPEIGSGFSRPGHPWGHSAGTGWASYTGPDSPAHNATWEDWERWYQREATNSTGKPPPQEPLYFSNTAFVSLIVLFAALGSFGQVTRVGDYSRTFIEQIESVHDECSKDLMKRRRSDYGADRTGTGNRNRDERIQTFLKMRDPVAYAGDEEYRSELPGSQVYPSGHADQE